MKIITAEQIESLHIAPAECVEWVKDAFLLKNRCQLPAKMSVHPAGNDFFTTMPCLLPDECHRFGVKVVSRILGRKPALKSDLMLFDSSNGELLALVDCDWITAMRTGAVATLAIRTFRSARAKTYAFVGLGSTARATLSCLLATSGHEQLRIRLFRYKDQAEKTIESFASYPDVAFETVDSMAQLADGADVLVSCITDAAGLLVEDDSCFDKVFADDTDHVRGFRYFQQFRQFHEFSEVLSGTCRGRESDTERILSYNIGLGLHDVYFANRIYRLLYPQCNL